MQFHIWLGTSTLEVPVTSFFQIITSPDDGGSSRLHHVGACLPNYMTPLPWRLIAQVSVKCWICQTSPYPIA